MERPEWFAVREAPKMVRTGLRRRKRSPHRAAILELLLETEDTYAEMARKVLISPGVVRVHVRNLYGEHFVTGREELRAKLGPVRETGAA